MGFLAVEKKRRRRIKRFIETGIRQARTQRVDDSTYVYVDKHKVRTTMYRKTKSGRLRKIREKVKTH